ncbi:HlyD family efflux transporter periplasmic adaptor subunit [Fulvivirgaceae bacterium BMA10]|uniref:HlyD family efflux transporter periplasmic adaptor subunit n=1 Tax=Splendidivirga corallicola TaxID=3051826 RepID=A0ABT8KHN9_9BACT|nr:HlyD family efflux transporter periplasmic adaptor subunit [Fulvivirgaceae bacterium BMA10]
MLNISDSNINIDRTKFTSFQKAEGAKSGGLLIRFSLFLLLLALIVMFLPWTQNIRSHGKVTTLKPDQRPQTIHSIIGGRIEHWYVQEGDFVKKGDTILYLSEIKDDYFDPDLLNRTRTQLESKKMAADSYMKKVEALDNQINALIETNKLKLQQASNRLKQAKFKLATDSTDYEAEVINYKIAKDQHTRLAELYEEGLKSLTDLENRKLTMQKARANMVSAQNKLLTSKNEVLNIQMELTSIQAQYRNAISKAQSEKYTALSSMYDSEAVVAKLSNQYTNYSIRTGLYYITAPQDGHITKTIQSGIGETVKEGEEIVSIMPAKYELAVEMYVRPIDLPLLEKGQHVRIQFDGWPAIVFSGWPNTSHGTYGGQVFAIDNFISDNGMYRVLVAPSADDHPWPNALRVGAGTMNMILLSDVSIWYELWRKINGFPPNYYKTAKK